MNLSSGSMNAVISSVYISGEHLHYPQCVVTGKDRPLSCNGPGYFVLCENYKLALTFFVLAGVSDMVGTKIEKQKVNMLYELKSLGT